MRTKNTKYGGIIYNKESDLYQTYFWNPFGLSFMRLCNL